MEIIQFITFLVAPSLVFYNLDVKYLNHPLLTFFWIILIVTLKIVILDFKTKNQKETDTQKVIFNLKEEVSYLYAILLFIGILSVADVFI